jgi:hypothetical protein
MVRWVTGPGRSIFGVSTQSPWPVPDTTMDENADAIFVAEEE